MNAKFIAQNSGGLALNAFLVLLGSALAVAGFNTDQRTRQTTQEAIAAADMDTYQAQELIRAQSGKADQRYKAGCFVMEQGTSLVDGNAYQFPQLSDGSFICDRQGNTGKIGPQGEVFDIVRTTNQVVIIRRLAKL